MRLLVPLITAMMASMLTLHYAMRIINVLTVINSLTNSAPMTCYSMGRFAISLKTSRAQLLNMMRLHIPANMPIKILVNKMPSSNVTMDWLFASIVPPMENQLKINALDQINRIKLVAQAPITLQMPSQNVTENKLVPIMEQITLPVTHVMVLLSTLSSNTLVFKTETFQFLKIKYNSNVYLLINK